MEVEFNFNGRTLTIPCNEYDIIGQIFQKFAIKIGTNINSLTFIYNGNNNINRNLQINQVINNIDKNRIQENNLNLNNDDNKNLDDNKSEKNNNEINNNEFDNHSINSPNMQMAIENVISFNNINDSEEKNIKENTNIKAKKLKK